jgi:hypothetical protein
MSTQINKYWPFQPSNVTDLLITLILCWISSIRWDMADTRDVSEVSSTSSSCDYHVCMYVCIRGGPDIRPLDRDLQWSICDYHTDRFTSGSRDSSVGIAITQRARWPRNRVSIPGRCKRFSILSAQTGSRASQSLIKWVPRVLPPPQGEVAAVSRLPLTSIPHIIKHRDNFNFY